MARRPEENFPLPKAIVHLAKACGWADYVRSQSNTGTTWVPIAGLHISNYDLSVSRGRNDLAAILKEAPQAARKRAAIEAELAAEEEAKASALLASAKERREKIGRISAALAALGAEEKS